MCIVLQLRIGLQQNVFLPVQKNNLKDEKQELRPPSVCEALWGRVGSPRGSVDRPVSCYNIVSVRKHLIIEYKTVNSTPYTPSMKSP